MTTNQSQATAEHNAHIKEFILDYCTSEISPQYAVMLNGEWGSGKTWFITEIIQELNKKQIKEIYVSLYGIANTSEIEYEFFRVLHPVLSSKGAEITGKILKGLLKGALKVDLDNDGKSESTLNPSVPDIKLPEYLNDTSKHILIFDDIERCSIPIDQLLGYINHFVEHQNYKVILVSNENEIYSKPDTPESNKYLKIKEKLIGKTFKVRANLESALDSFIADSKEIDFYSPLRACIKETYAHSQHNNLRNLRQALLDFSRLKGKIPHTALSNPSLVEHLLRVFLTLSFELRQGNLTPEQVSRLHKIYIEWHVNKSSSQEIQPSDSNIIETVFKKYPRFDTYDTLLTPELWREILIDGYANEEEIRNQLENSRYLVSRKSPNWVKLWHFTRLSDEAFKELTEKVLEEFKELKYQQDYELKHIYGMYLYLNKISLSAIGKDTITDIAKKVVIELFAQEKLATNDRGFSDDTSAVGLGYMCSESEEFKDFCKFIREKKEEAFKLQLPALAAKLFKLIHDDPSEFARQLIHSNIGSCAYYEVPILAYIDGNDFINAYLDSQSEQKSHILYIFKERYKHPTSAKKLVDELSWLFGLAGILAEKARSKKGKLSGYICNSLLEHYVQPAIKDLDDIRASNHEH